MQNPISDAGGFGSDNPRLWIDQSDISATQHGNRSCHEDCLAIDVDVIELRHSVHADGFGGVHKLRYCSHPTGPSAAYHSHPVSCERVKLPGRDIRLIKHHNCCQHDAGRFVDSVISSLALGAPYGDSPHHAVYLRAMPVQVEGPVDIHHLESLARTELPSLPGPISPSGNTTVHKPPVSPATVSTAVGSSSPISLEAPCPPALRFPDTASAERCRSQPSPTGVPSQFLPASNIYITIDNGGVKGGATKTSSRQTGGSRSRSTSSKIMPRRSTSRPSPSRHPVRLTSSLSTGNRALHGGRPTNESGSQGGAASVAIAAPYVEVQDYEQTEITEHIEQSDGTWKATGLPRGGATASTDTRAEGTRTFVTPSPSPTRPRDSPAIRTQPSPSVPISGYTPNTISPPMFPPNLSSFTPSTSVSQASQPIRPSYSTTLPSIARYSSTPGFHLLDSQHLRGPTVLRSQSSQGPFLQPAGVSTTSTTYYYAPPTGPQRMPSIVRSQGLDTTAAATSVSPAVARSFAGFTLPHPLAGHTRCLSEIVPIPGSTLGQFTKSPPPPPTTTKSPCSFDAAAIPTVADRLTSVNGSGAAACSYSSRLPSTTAIPQVYPPTYPSFIDKPQFSPQPMAFIPVASSYPNTELAANDTTSSRAAPIRFAGLPSATQTHTVLPTSCLPTSHSPLSVPMNPTFSAVESILPNRFAPYLSKPRKKIEGRTLKIRSQRTVTPIDNTFPA